jgi:uncharacterized repeat protein (TIGR01451 family)
MRRLTLLLGVVLSIVAAVIAGVVGGTGSAGAAPARPDLVVAVTVDPTELSPAGGVVHVTVEVRNVGSGPATDVRVKVRPPAGSSLAGEASGSWRCDYSTWKCMYIEPDSQLVAPLDAGAQADPLVVPLRLPAAPAGADATISATASTSSLETSTANNTGKATVRYTFVADLATELLGVDTEWSNLGGRAYVQARITNVGTAPVSDLRLTMTPPPGTEVWLDIFTADEWQCQLTTAPWVCTRGALAAGELAYLNIPLRYPAGTTGDTVTMTATASTTTPERSLANNTAEMSFRYITPAPADVALTGLDVYPQQVVAGDQITIWIVVDNIGGSPADNVTVRLPLPDTVQPVSSDGSGADWACTVSQDPGGGQRVWECVHPRYEPNGLELVSPIELLATVNAGTPDGPLTFTATVSTDSPEQSTDNNTVQGTTTYQAQGFISGRVWLDQDRDGQRDPDEPAVTSGADGVRLLQFLPEGATGPSWDTPAAYTGGDGSYLQRLAPGRYFVEVTVAAALDFTTPNVGDEATDSDVTFKTRLSDGVMADSAVVDVIDGQHTIVDIGLVPAQP